MRDVTAFILAGGNSTRMGEEKAFVEIGGRLLIDHALRRLKSLECDIFIVGPKSRFNAFGRVIEDKHVGKGPLAGLEAALERSETEFNVITAVDTPLVPSTLFLDLLKALRSSNADVIIPRAAGGLHPLTGIYRRSFLDTVKTAIAGEQLKIDAAILSRPYLIFEAEAQGFFPEQFINLNDPEDVALARKVLASGKGQAATP